MLPLSFSRVLATTFLLGASSVSVSVAAAGGKGDTSSYLTTTLWAPEDYGPGYNTYASVIGVDAIATTYQLDCYPFGQDLPADYKGCSAWDSVTLTVGVKTAEIVASHGGEFHATRGVACSVDAPRASAQCDFILDGRGAEAVAQTGRWPLDPITDEEYEWYSQAITITAGAEKLRAGAANGGSAAATTTPVGSTAGDAPKATTGSSPLVSGAQATGTGTGTGNAPTGSATSGALGSRGYLGGGVAMMGAVAVVLGSILL